MSSAPASPVFLGRIGVDGGGTKTECLLIDAEGAVIARVLAPGCNPNIIGPAAAGQIVREALADLLAQARTRYPALIPERTLLCMAGIRSFWQEFAASLEGCGRVHAVDDSLPVLELATDGGPGLVLHSGTGSFVAARDPEGGIHYAGGLGWRFGDAGSGYEIGRRAVAAALLEHQGWREPSALSPLIRRHSGADEAGAITRYYYQHPEANRQIAALAPDILGLAAEGSDAARDMVRAACEPLLALAHAVVQRRFPGVPPQRVRAGLSGAILTHPWVAELLSAHTALPLFPLTLPPSEGVRRLLVRPETALGNACVC